jgi:hypothetical protein
MLLSIAPIKVPRMIHEVISQRLTDSGSVELFR